jgi:hypothetical protein
VEKFATKLQFFKRFFYQNPKFFDQNFYVDASPTQESEFETPALNSLSFFSFSFKKRRATSQTPMAVIRIPKNLSYEVFADSMNAYRTLNVR